MSIPPLSRTSLYTVLSVIVFTAVGLVLSGHAIYSYLSAKERLIERMKFETQQSISALKQDVAGMMAAYAVNEYDKLISNEMLRRDYMAIVIEDFRLRQILDGKLAMSGKIRDERWRIDDFDFDNIEHQQLLERSFFSRRYDILDRSGEKLGAISIYMSDRELSRDLHMIIWEALVNAAGLAVLLSMALFLSIRRFILHPLTQIGIGLRKHDVDGIPFDRVPVSGPREITKLAETMNGMIATITQSRSALRESESKRETILQTVVEGIVTVNLAGQITYANNTALHILDIGLDEITHCYFQAREWRQIDARGEEFPADRLPLAIALGERRVVEDVEHGIIDSDGNRRWLSVNAAPLFDEMGQMIGAVASFRDITDRQQADLRLEQFRIALETTHDGFMIVNSQGLILESNQAYADIVGYTLDELRDMHISQLEVREQTKAEVDMHIAKIMEAGYETFETRHRHKDGHEIDMEISVSYEPESMKFISFCRDITTRKKRENTITTLAFYDQLTGLPNRRLMQDRLAQAAVFNARNNETGALLFVDLDNFKVINDSLGHAIGDLLLQQASQRLESCVRAGDTVARPGGDEFIVILHGLNRNLLEAASRADMVGQKILSTLNQPYRLAEHECFSSASIGVALFGGDDEQALEDKLKRADIALYEAKKSGRNTLRFFDPGMQKSIDEHVAVERALRSALDQKEFELYFQVQMNHQGLPIGAEALIRWNSPERGFVSPADFIPMAEESGQIVAIGSWVLDSACERLKAWQQDATTCELILSVNVSAKQFNQVDFVSQVRAAIEHHSVDPSLLKLELTESILLENVESMISKMEALRKIGVRFSLDDFGTGYSSLQYLKRLPLDQVKIDQSFVRDILTDSNDKAIVRTIIAMAKNLNLEVIAEGVESEAQRQVLLSKGCRYFQGYLFSRPLPLDQFEKMLRN